MERNLRETLGLMREIYRGYKAEMAAVAAYTYGQILFEKHYPALSDLLATIARAEMRHYHTLGALLRELGASHALKITLQDFAYRNGQEPDSVVQQYLKDRIRYEKSAADHYRRLCLSAATEEAKQALLMLARDEEEHAAALEATLLRLSAS